MQILDWNTATVKDCGEKHERQWHNRVRDHAKRVMGEELKNAVCARCGYSNHVEICHLKPIKDFEDSDLLVKVNDKSNLVLLCPNCHWELDNYFIGFDNGSFYEIPSESRPAKLTTYDIICDFCTIPFKSLAPQAKYCNNTCRAHSQRRVQRPIKEDLERELNSIPVSHIAKKYGVADNSIKKWLRNYGIEIPEYRKRGKSKVRPEGVAPSTIPKSGD
jgi:hypothetical protein